MVATSNRNSKDCLRGDVAMKKGPWTTGEDAILMEYVRKHGEGNWNAVQRNCGLSRCGKSCRLRWANHLRPNLKKGSFTPDEERLIIELHSKIGNKWARMASQLPGRTDNEIKNYWNTRVKRLQRAGLPIYPDDIPNNYQNNYSNQQINHNSSISPPPYSSQYNNSISFLHPVLNFPTMITPQFFPHSNNRVISNLPMPLVTPISQLGLQMPSSSFFRQNFRMLGPYSPFGFVNDPERVELSSIQIQETGTRPPTPASSATSGSGVGDYNANIVIQEEGYLASDSLEEGNNSGLLETLLEESNALAQAQKLKKEVIDKEEDSSGGPNFCPLPSSSGMKEETMEETNQLDDDLSSLLNNFTPVSDWYDASTNANTNTHNEQKSELVLDATTSKDTKWDRGSRCNWNNMPSIC